MKSTVLLTYFILCINVFYSCRSTKFVQPNQTRVSDPLAGPEAKLLYYKIKTFSKEGIAVGHQDATVYGVQWKYSQKNNFKSDIHDVTEKYPAVYGWDVGHIELGNLANLDSVSFSLMKQQIIAAHNRGGINTISWHLDNPESNGSSWDTISAVSTVLKEGKNRDKYENWVKNLAIFFKSLKTEDGNLIPIVFRPYHEMNGSWFWWGSGNCTVEEYKAIFRQTVDLLKDNNVHNLLYSYAPNTLNTPEEYEKFYPGDDYVDVLGIDIYNHSGDKKFVQTLKDDIAVMRDFAIAHNKPYALTETGNTKPGKEKWWTDVLYPGIKDSGIAWLLLWRNARESHYFATYPSELSGENFKTFSNKDDILFLKDIQPYNYKISE